MSRLDLVQPGPQPPAPAAVARSTRSRLSRRLAWLTAGAVLIAEALFFLSSLASVRQAWLERRLREGQLAALAATAGPVPDALRDDLLRLAGVDAAALREPGRTIMLARPGIPWEAKQHLTLRAENVAVGLFGAIGGLFRAGDALLHVEGPSTLRDGATVSVLVHRRDLDDALTRYLRRDGLISLLVAVTAGVVLYGALTVVLVRPMRRLSARIAAFRADPERSAPFPAPAHPDDEVATAGRELAAMQRELRTAVWRNARLAALGVAVAKISHDLRGILSPALLTAERLQMNPDPAIKRAGDTVLRAVERATELVRRAVEYAREVPLAPNRQRMRLRAAVADAADQTRALCPALRIENMVAETLEVDADPDSVVRVLANLLRNAGEAQARCVRVMAEEDAAGVAVIVSDDGPGLPPAVREALFQPFVLGTRPGSTGLGLAIVRDLVRAHGGDVELIATNASGTTFRFVLPRPSRTTVARASAEMRG